MSSLSSCQVAQLQSTCKPHLCVRLKYISIQSCLESSEFIPIALVSSPLNLIQVSVRLNALIQSCERSTAHIALQVGLNNLLDPPSISRFLIYVEHSLATYNTCSYQSNLEVPASLLHESNSRHYVYSTSL